MDDIYIAHKSDTTDDGCGVFVGKLFMTAGHVIQDTAFGIRKDGVIHSFSKDGAMLCEYMAEGREEPDGADIAVFEQELLNSPLKLSNKLPILGQVCVSVSFHNRGWSGNPVESPYEVIKGKATIQKIEGNFFLCSMEKPLRRGASGSPLFNQDGEVLGILTHGDYEHAVCVFMSSVSIVNKITRM